MNACAAELMEKVQRPGWRWDIWARVLRNDGLDLIICPELLEALKVQDVRQLQVVLLSYETKETLGNSEGFPEAQGARACNVRMRLKGGEALALLSMAGNGSFPMRAAGVSATEKLRRALGPNARGSEIAITCTEDEAEFIARARLA